MKVLLVDDERHVLEGLKTMIDWTKMSITEVLTAMNGEEALQSYLNDRPDILISDVAMPKMTGLELAARIRKSDPDIPILFLSGYDDFEYAREAIHLHVSRYILKPAVYYEIEQAIQEMIIDLEAKRKQRKYAEQFNSYVEQSLPMLREQFLYDLVSGMKREADLSEGMLHFYGVNSLSSGGIIVGFMLYRPQQGRAKTERDWQLFKYSAANIVDETAILYARQERAQIYSLRYSENWLPILITNTDAAGAERIALELAETVLNHVTNLLDLELNAAIGRWYGKAEELHKSYREVVETLRSLDFEGYHKIMTVDQAASIVSNEHRYPARLVQLCIEAMQKFNPTDVTKQWGELKEWLLQEDVPLGVVQIVCITLWGNLSLELAGKMNTEANTILPEWVRGAQENRSKENIVAWIDEQFRLVLEPLQQRDSQQLLYARQIMQYIEEHYPEPISFDELSKKLHLTRNYLSYLFKKETGTSFIHYLTNYRIERAKELLMSRQYMIYEISEMVGYSDPAYFSRVFKKVTGVAPLEYV